MWSNLMEFMQVVSKIPLLTVYQVSSLYVKYFLSYIASNPSTSEKLVFKPKTKMSPSSAKTVICHETNELESPFFALLSINSFSVFV